MKSLPSQPIPADSMVGKFKTVTIGKLFQTEMTGDTMETVQKNGPKKTNPDR